MCEKQKHADQPVCRPRQAIHTPCLCPQGLQPKSQSNIGLHQFVKGFIIRQILVPMALNGKRSGEVIAAPDKRHPL